jgi:hypothetical protein
VAENRRPGTSSWCIPTNAPADIQGYADHISAHSGSAVALFVSTTARLFRVDAYRLGFYQGLGGRLIWQSRWLPGQRQPVPAPSRPTNLVEAGWRSSIRLRITSRWPPGVYLLKLVASDGGQSYIPLVIRDDASRASLLLQESTITWQAYNVWGGYSLYYGPDRRFEDRARVVSFDRPYVRNRGSGDLLQGGDQPLIVLVERLGLDVTYATDVDVDASPAMLLRHRALVVVCHGEYWSGRMRAAATVARNRGVNLLFLQANDVYRHVRLASSPLGADRRVIDYKVAREDPLFGRDNGLGDC